MMKIELYLRAVCLVRAILMKWSDVVGCGGDVVVDEVDDVNGEEREVGRGCLNQRVAARKGGASDCASPRLVF